MKKIFAMMAAVAALGLSSCSNEMEEVADNSVKDIKLNITVADLNLGDAQTRAVKSGWANGDKINIWFDENRQPKPDFVIMYNGSEWEKVTDASYLSGNTPKPSGKIIYLYEGYNNLNEYTRDYNEESNFTRFSEATPKLTFVNNGEDESLDVHYTYSAETLSFDINNWAPLTAVQVVVTGINCADYRLTCPKIRSIEGFGLSTYGFWSTSTWGGYAYGFPNDDGAVFYFDGVSVYGNTDYEFTLQSVEDASEEYTYTATNKYIDAYAFTAIKIDKSKFGIE